MSGDDVLRAIETVYAGSFARFYRVAFAIVRDREAAWDVVQDGFAAALKGRDGFRGEAPLEVWLWRVIVNRALAVARQPKAGALAVEELSLESLDEPWLSGDTAGAVGALPARQRLVLFLRFYADLDYRSISEVAGISVGTVSATLYAALAALRRELEVSR
jgi:RNA polymerase sigma-70 factor (ECF subfamily)